MGVLPNSIYASEALLPISFRAADFLQIYVPFVTSTDATGRCKDARRRAFGWVPHSPPAIEQAALVEIVDEYFAHAAAGVDEDALNAVVLADFLEAHMIVRVSVTEIFRNCPRYVHRYKKISASEYVPRAGTKTPLAGWKRVDAVQPELAAT